MVVNFEEQSRELITTEPIDNIGSSGASLAWDFVRNAFSQSSCIGYWCYPIFLKVGEIRKETDILIVDREIGIIAFVIIPFKIDQFAAMNGSG